MKGMRWGEVGQIEYKPKTEGRKDVSLLYLFVSLVCFRMDEDVVD